VKLVQSKLLRAIYSDRQLQEVMTDFGSITLMCSSKKALTATC